ncbi:MAG: glutathione S-transferase family protein [Gammaproteobacteria bacterium]
MKLYTFPMSPNCLRVVAAANQAGIKLDYVIVDLTKGEHMKPEFIKLNPNHKVPTLVDGDYVLWESTAILVYLAQVKPDSGLIPADLKQRMLLLQWMSWNTAQFSPACGVFVFENLVKKLLNMGAPDAAALGKAKADFKRFGKVLDDHLQGRKYLVGDQPTVADHHVVSIFVHAEAGQIPVGEFKEIGRWSKALFSSEPWKKALAEIRR